MKANSRLQFEAAAISLQARDLLIDVRLAKRDEQKVALFPRIEAVLVNACDRLRAARKNRTTRVRTSPQTQTPWGLTGRLSSPESSQGRTAQPIKELLNEQSTTTEA